MSVLAKLKLMPLTTSCCIFQNNTHINIFTRFLIHHLNSLFSYVTVPEKRDHLGNFFKIELLLQKGRVGFELQNVLHI